MDKVDSYRFAGRPIPTEMGSYIYKQPSDFVFSIESTWFNL